jgi:ubiquinone/menaquinone biosynthesis C-methylase UbiE
MGVYNDQVVPRLIDFACGTKSTRPLRQRVCQGLSGDVVEIGFGSGLNCAYYPDTVNQVMAVEPSDVGWRMAGKRVQRTQVQVERAGLDGQSLPFDDDSFDAALSTWTLCTIPDASAALSELRRVLRPGATLHFVEHGLAPDESVRRFQQRVEPLHKRFFGGCHVTRSIVGLVSVAGFRIIELDEFYEAKAPKYGGAYSLGVAVSP